jgi:hypothetical protein
VGFPAKRRSFALGADEVFLRDLLTAFQAQITPLFLTANTIFRKNQI